MADQNYETAARLGRTIGLLVVVILLLTGFIVYLLMPEPHEPIVFATCGTVDYIETEIPVLPPKVFNDNCASCHFLQDKMLVGPSLYAVLDRVPSDEWFDGYVSNEDRLIALRDPYTLKLNAGYSLNYSHNFPYLSKADLDELKQMIRNL